MLPTNGFRNFSSRWYPSWFSCAMEVKLQSLNPNHSTTELSTEILSKVSFGSWFRASANCLYKPFIEYHTRKLLLNNRISFFILKNSALFGRGYSIVPLEGRDPEKYKFELFATCLLSFYRIKTWWEKKTICISSPTNVTTGPCILLPTTMYIVTYYVLTTWKWSRTSHAHSSIHPSLGFLSNFAWEC